MRSKSVILLGWILLAALAGCHGPEAQLNAQVRLSAETAGFGEYDEPTAFEIKIHNDEKETISIYRPLYTQYYFRDFEIEYLDGKQRSSENLSGVDGLLAQLMLPQLDCED